jgi:hypothetical protein
MLSNICYNQSQTHHTIQAIWSSTPSGHPQHPNHPHHPSHLGTGQMASYFDDRAIVATCGLIDQLAASHAVLFDTSRRAAKMQRSIGYRDCAQRDMRTHLRNLVRDCQAMAAKTLDHIARLATELMTTFTVELAELLMSKCMVVTNDAFRVSRDTCWSDLSSAMARYMAFKIARRDVQTVLDKLRNDLHNTSSLDTYHTCIDRVASLMVSLINQPSLPKTLLTSPATTATTATPATPATYVVVWQLGHNRDKPYKYTIGVNHIIHAHCIM